VLPYAERLTVSAVYWLLVPLAAASTAAVLAAVDGRLAVGGAVLAAAATAAALVRAGVLVEVSAVGLRAGRAIVGPEHLGAAEALDAAATRHELGPGLDARAFLVTRPWVATAVRVAILDPRDPVPYWLVSTRHPDRVVGALAAARAGGGPQAAHSEQTS
jgi:hypothetical protein